MRIAHIQPTSGIAGNMWIAACLDAGCPWEVLAAVLEAMGIGAWTPIRESVLRGGLRGQFFDVALADPVITPGHHHDDHHSHDHHSHAHEHQGPHRHYTDIVALVESAGHLSATVRRRALEALGWIGAVESHLHQVPLDELHLHELGAMDTIIDVVGGMVAAEWLGLERIYADPVHVGAGHRQTAHGLVPIPTPATLEILRGIPLVAAGLGMELTTPTGAAVLRVLLEESGTIGQSPPAYSASAVGYGAGSAEFPGRPNLLRLVIGETVDSVVGWQDPRWDTDRIGVLTTNLDDVSPEIQPWVVSRLLAAGALDVTLTPTIMKGGRPGVMLQVLTPLERIGQALELLFQAGITLGVRVEEVSRAVLRRRMETGQLTDGSPVPVKVGLLGEAVVYRKPEHRAVVEAAEAQGQGRLDTLPPWAVQS